MPGVLDLCALDRQLERVLAAKRLTEQPHDLAPPLLEAGELLELPQPERGLDVGHVVFEAGREDVVAPAPAAVVALPGVAAHPVEAQHPGTIQQLGVARQHAALAGRQVLGGVEAEGDRVVPRAHQAALVPGGNRVGRVLDDRQARAPRHVPDGIELDRVAGVVDGQNRPGARRDGPGHGDGIDVEGVRLDIDQHGPRAHVLDHVHRGGEGERGGDHLGAGPDPERGEGRVHAGGAGAQREGAGRPEVRRELGLEPLRLRTGGDPVRPQRVHDFLDLFLADKGRREGQELLAAGTNGGHGHRSPSLGSVGGGFRQRVRATERRGEGHGHRHARRGELGRHAARRVHHG